VLLAMVGARDPSGLTALVRDEVEQQPLRLALAGTSLRALRYRPVNAAAANSKPILLLHGVHPDGIDHRDLQRFARALAGVGLTVYTPELPALTRFRLEPATIDTIEQCACSVAQRHGGKAPGVFGISFAGGLALMAAAGDGGASCFDQVVGIGAHHSIGRLLGFYTGAPGQDPDGRPAPVRPDPYGARVLAYAFSQDLFAPADLEIARRALLLWLENHKSRARAELERVGPDGRELLGDLLTDAALPAPSAQALAALPSRQKATLERLSPAGKMAGVGVPVFLIHGQGDRVIPASETRQLANELPAQSRKAVLITPLLGHTELEARPSFGEHLAVVAWLTRVLAR